MGDVGDYWNDVKEHRRRQKQEFAKTADACLQELVARGYQVIRFSEHHYRVDQRFDYWPTTGRWKQVNGKLSGSMIKPLLEALKK